MTDIFAFVWRRKPHSFMFVTEEIRASCHDRYIYIYIYINFELKVQDFP